MKKYLTMVNNLTSDCVSDLLSNLSLAFSLCPFFSLKFLKVYHPIYPLKCRKTKKTKAKQNDTNLQKSKL